MGFDQIPITQPGIKPDNKPNIYTEALKNLISYQSFTKDELTKIYHLLKLGADINVIPTDRRSELLRDIILLDDLQLFIEFVSLGFSIEDKDYARYAALDHAIDVLCPTIVSWLLEKGADPNGRCKGHHSNFTRMHLLCFTADRKDTKKLFEVAKNLLSHGGDLLREDRDCCLPIHYISWETEFKTFIRDQTEIQRNKLLEKNKNRETQTNIIISEKNVTEKNQLVSHDDELVKDTQKMKAQKALEELDLGHKKDGEKGSTLMEKKDKIEEKDQKQKKPSEGAYCCLTGKTYYFDKIDETNQKQKKPSDGHYCCFTGKTYYFDKIEEKDQKQKKPSEGHFCCFTGKTYYFDKKLDVPASDPKNELIKGKEPLDEVNKSIKQDIEAESLVLDKIRQETKIAETQLQALLEVIKMFENKKKMYKTLFDDLSTKLKELDH